MSREVSLAVLDNVSADFDEPAKIAKAEVESLYLGGGSFSPQSRKANARKRGIKGFGYFGDNVGKVKAISSIETNTCLDILLHS